MMYDDWKLKTPPEEKEQTCNFCGEESDREFCSTECKKAYEND